MMGSGSGSGSSAENWHESVSSFVFLEPGQYMGEVEEAKEERLARLTGIQLPCTS